MVERVVTKRAVPKIATVEGLFDAKKSIKSSHTGELVIALCGPIGSPIHKVGEMIKTRLKDDFAYDECEIIRLAPPSFEGKGNGEGWTIELRYFRFN